ncbi:hypothetical protein VitviT2T_003302 [Vitis vinifera]|uniref:NAD-dependent epimerase/dehydratase domain-containing protein n=1 Tax=Vitis vinifera TaxID=29760 RepID=A0ABY9BMN6_VITVI|nr:hypothetical protein VitviT2T_003302 [Vitis vinifera]
MDQKMKVYVTGASGFLASWLVKRHLLSGYHVIGTVRDPEILVPAVEGTLNVLRSCKKNPSLRRVVLTSSTSAVRARDDFDPKIPLQDESSWSSVEFCERLQVTSLSSERMERLNWNKQGRLRNADGLEGWNMFTSMMLHSATSILVYEHEDAHGRYLCSSAELDDNELTSLLSARYPSLPIPKRSDALDIPYVEFNTSKLKSLGFKFKSIQDMFDDCIASLVEEGHLGQV